VHFKKIVEMVDILKWRIFWKLRIRVCIKITEEVLPVHTTGCHPLCYSMYRY